LISFNKNLSKISYVKKASWTYDGNSINLIKLTSDTLGDTSNYLANGEWNLNYLLVERAVKIYSCCPNP